MTDEGGKRGVVEMGGKVRKNEISLGQPGVVYILADGVIENLS